MPTRSLTISVMQRHCNHSAFNGGRYTPSAYSEVRCGDCNWPWRTKSPAVHALPDGAPR